MWVIDNDKYAQAFIDAGYRLPPKSDKDPRYRCGVLTLDNIEYFLAQVSNDELSANDLHQLLSSCLPTDSWWDICNYIPQLYYDFNDKLIYSAHEQHIFEKYIPEDWKVMNSEPWDDVPQEMQYWIFDDQDFLKKQWKT